MSGQDGIRGYTVQSIIALLDSLSRSDWDTLTIEPSHDLDKIDILWSGPLKTRAYQVKSSINQINLPDAKKWAVDLESESIADELALILIGPCSQSVARIKRCGAVDIPCPKSLDIEGMLGQAAHLLDIFLVNESFHSQSPSHRELMVRALVAEMSFLSSNSTPFGRSEFIALLKKWLQGVAVPPEFTWDIVDFSYQRGIENAISGKRLGPADVEECPQFPICDYIFDEIERTHWYSIVGESGCGKSITAWHVAKRFFDLGFTIWRPHFDANANDLLKNIPVSSSPSLLVVDDAHVFGRSFVERLSEYSCTMVKIIFVSTLAECATPNPSYISATGGLSILKDTILQRRAEILPIVQAFDSNIGDRYMDRSFERLIDNCAQQKSPWEFFWVLRGGWKAAKLEYNNLKDIRKSNILAVIISLLQVASCDFGVSKSKLDQVANEFDIYEDDVDRILLQLDQLEIIVVSGSHFRTKHIDYARRIISTALDEKEWQQVVKLISFIVLDRDISLRGVYWVLGAIKWTSSFKFHHKEELRNIVSPLLDRCSLEWKQDVWAIGCASSLFTIFDLSAEEIIFDEQVLLCWFSFGSGKEAFFASDIANTLITKSNVNELPNSKDIAKKLFEKIDVNRLIALANDLTVDDFYHFGSLLDRISFYHPQWLEVFFLNLKWGRFVNIINSVDTSFAYAVDKFVGTLCYLSGVGDGERNFNFGYVEDIIPYLVRAINKKPANALQSMDCIFWNSLGYYPAFLRNGVNPNTAQRQIAGKIVSQLDPEVFAASMKDIISRDVEKLARSLSIINEIDKEFVYKIVPFIPEEEFLAATRADWQNQSSEISNVLVYFCRGEEHSPASKWIEHNEIIIDPPLTPLFAAIAPKVAVKFYNDGKGVALTQKYQHRWNQTALALHAISVVDKEVAVSVFKQNSEKLKRKLYSLTLDKPRYVVLFFKVLYELSSSLADEFVNEIDLDNPEVAELIAALARRQHNERANYIRLARLARKVGGVIGELGEQFLHRLECELTS